MLAEKWNGMAKGLLWRSNEGRQLISSLEYIFSVILKNIKHIIYCAVTI